MDGNGNQVNLLKLASKFHKISEINDSYLYLQEFTNFECWVVDGNGNQVNLLKVASKFRNIREIDGSPLCLQPWQNLNMRQRLETKIKWTCFRISKNSWNHIDQVNLFLADFSRLKPGATRPRPYSAPRARSANRFEIPLQRQWMMLEAGVTTSTSLFITASEPLQPQLLLPRNSKLYVLKVS